MYFEPSKKVRQWSLVSRSAIIISIFSIIYFNGSSLLALPVAVWGFIHLALFLRVDTTRDADDIL